MKPDEIETIVHLTGLHSPDPDALPVAGTLYILMEGPAK